MNDHNKNASHAVRIELVFKDNISFIRSYVNSIKQGGLFIRAEEPFPVDTPVKLNIKFSHISTDINIDAVVVLSNPCPEKGYFPRGMAVRFLKTEPEGKEIIDSIISEYKNQINIVSMM